MLAAQELDFGSIEISSNPSGAAVYVEGFLVGSTPLTAQRLPPRSPYRLVIKKDSRDDFVRDVRVVAGEITRVSADLTPDSGAWQSIVRQQDDWAPILKGQRKRYQKAKSKRSLRSYKVVEVSNFLVKSDETVSPHHRYALLQHLALQLDERAKFENLVTTYTSAPSGRWMAEGSGEPTLVLSGVITYFRPGNRLRRSIGSLAGGWGVGDTEIHCLFRIADKETNEVLLERLVKGVASGTSGSSKATKAVAKQIAKAVAKNW